MLNRDDMYNLEDSLLLLLLVVRLRLRLLLLVPVLALLLVLEPREFVGGGEAGVNATAGATNPPVRTDDSIRRRRKKQSKMVTKCS